LKRKTGDFAVAAAAVQLTLGKNGAIERAASPHECGTDADRAVDAAKYLVGKMPDEKTLAEAGGWRR